MPQKIETKADRNRENAAKFLPSTREQEIVSQFISKFRLTQDDRNRVFELLDNRNIVEYIEDSVHNYIANTDARDGIEDWQSRVHDQFTNNKVTAFLGKVLSVLPIPAIAARGDEDTKRSSIMNDLYRFSEDQDSYEEKMLYALEEAIVKGVAVVYEGISVEERHRRDVKGFGDKTIITKRTEKTTKIFSELVPLEEFYPASVKNRNIKDNPFCFWRTEMGFEKFMASWGSMYDKAKLVEPKRTFLDEEDKPFYIRNITDDTKEGNVEVIRYYNSVEDHYVIIANGVWLNPIDTTTADGVLEDIAPLPFNHKELPFWSIKFSSSGDWFYGRSLADKLSSMQAVLNTLTNMLLDQSFLTIFPPLITNGFDSIEDDYLRPGRRTPIDTQGLPISDAFQKIDLGVPTGWHQFILQYSRSVMEESSLDKVSQGIAGQGDRTTAREINEAAAGVAAIVGLFSRLINHGLKQKAMLRVANILQAWTDPDNPYLVGILSESGIEKSSKAFNLFEIDGTTLSTGKRGTRVIEMFRTEAEAPTGVEQEARQAVTKIATGKNVEYHAITPSYIRNFRYDVKIEMDPQKDSTKELRQAMQLEKLRVYMSFFPDMINKEELLAQTAEVMGDDIEKIISEQVLNPQPQENNPELDPGVSQNPEGNVAGNMVRGLGAENTSIAGLRGLMQ